MSRIDRASRFAWITSIAVSMACAHSPTLLAADAFPQVSPDGLQLHHSTQFNAVYLKPGATFSQYKRLALLDCYVDFAKNWERDYNQDQPGLEGRITPEDMNRIKAEVATEFKSVFTEELQTKGGYQIVDVAAPDVLILRPAILNLMVTAPGVDTPDMGFTVVASAGQMTLYLELWDSTTNTILARVIDTEADPGGVAMVADRVSNKVAGDRILKHWADLLRQRLDQVRGTTSGDR